MNKARAERVRAERAAERRVLEAVECGPLFGIEIEPGRASRTRQLEADHGSDGAV